MSAVFGLELITAYLLLMALLTLFVAVLTWQRHRAQRTIGVWLASGVGILLGSVGSFAAVRLAGNTIVKAHVGAPSSSNLAGASSAGMSAPQGSGMSGMGGMGGMGGGMMGPQPKRDLASLVRKLDLLTGEISITLAPNQAAIIVECLKDIDKAEELSDDDAKGKHEQILAALDERQKARLDAIGLPRPAGRGAGGPGGRGGGLGGPGMGGGGPGGGAPTPPANPFQQETDGKALASLLGKLAPNRTGPAAPGPRE
jgi:hypothetical protein